MSFAKPSTTLATASSVCRQCRIRIHQQHILRASLSTKSVPAHLRNGAEQTSNDNATAPPRWARTPQAMRAPFRVRPKNDNDDYPVNEDGKLLDSAYIKMLGDNGHRLLPDEVKWLAVTHKSFDHGRRGFNDRLAFLGMAERVTITVHDKFLTAHRETYRRFADLPGLAKCPHRKWRLHRPSGGRHIRAHSFQTRFPLQHRECFDQHKRQTPRHAETSTAGRALRPEQRYQMEAKTNQ